MFRPHLLKSMNGYFVSIYKVFGFAVLTSLVLGMGAFLVTNVFFMLNRSWIVPIILTPSHDRVVQTRVNYMEQTFQADKLRNERTAMEAQLQHIKRAIRLHEQFEANFVKALASEERQKRERLARLSKLGKELGASAKAGAGSAKTYAQMTEKQLEKQYSARLIAQEDLIKGRYLVNQLAVSDVIQKERYEDVVDKIKAADAEVKAQAEANRALSKGELDAARATPELGVLLREQQYLSAEIARSELESRVIPLEQQLATINRLLGEHEQLLTQLSASPYVRAAKEPVTIAFVSYDNLPEVKVGSHVLGCYLSFVLCKKTGKVVKILDGEVTARHPMTNRDVRGVMVEIALQDAKWAERSSLMLNHAPLLL